MIIIWLRSYLGRYIFRLGPVGQLGGQKKNKSAKAEIVVQEITVWQHSPDFYGIMAAHLKKSVVTVVDK